MSGKQVSGTCLCKSVTISFRLETENFGACHCGMCRTWAGVPALAVEGTQPVEYKGKEFISVYDSSKWGERGFCKKCGTHLFFRMKSGEYINFPLGFLQGVDHLKFDTQIFIDKKPANYSFSNPTKNKTEDEFFAQYK